MEVTTIAPSAPLAPFVDRFTIVETRDEVARVLLPECGLVLGVRYAGAATSLNGERATRMPDFTLTGILGATRHMRTHAKSGVVLAQFRPAGAAAFFRTSLDELFGSTVSLDALVARADVERLGDRVASQRDHGRRIAVVEEFLLERLAVNRADSIVTVAVRAIEASRGVLRMASLADELAIGQNSLERRFRRAIGTSPKQLASLIRVRHAIDIGRRGVPWSRVAHEAGYFDQSHFIRDFRAVTGQAPTRFFGGVEYC
jgi:AraC-like DNA-binding protein